METPTFMVGPGAPTTPVEGPEPETLTCPCYYRALGLAPTTSRAAIQLAYDLCMEHLVAMNGAVDAETWATTMKVAKAYKVLIDPSTRAAYDASIRAATTELESSIHTMGEALTRVIPPAAAAEREFKVTEQAVERLIPKEKEHHLTLTMELMPEREEEVRQAMIKREMARIKVQGLVGQREGTKKEMKKDEEELKKVQKELNPKGEADLECA